MDANKRRRASKGQWMKLTDADLLHRYMLINGFSQARLGRYAGCSRQFIHMLVTGAKSTCTKQVGELIEEALRVLPGTLFVLKLSPATRSFVAQQRTAA